MTAIASISITDSTQVSFVRSGVDFFDIMKSMINQAKSEIHLQTYILIEDQIGNQIIDLLKKASARGVKIYLLLDGFGSKSLSKNCISELKKNQIHFRFFSPIFSASFFNFSRRLHQKVLVTDSQNILIGGINIADKYCGDQKKLPWLDYAVLIRNNSLGESMQTHCMAIYERKWYINPRKIVLKLKGETFQTISILQNDWLKRKKQIQNAYIKNIREAKEEIIIVGSYFFPGKKLISALKEASQNNVEIKLILSGLSDVELSKKATNYLYNKLLQLNIKIYEWNKSVLHAKTAVIDQKWTTIGSFNLNNLSAYASIEMNVAIDSIKLGNKFAQHLEEIISQCENISVESLKIKNNRQTRFVNWCAYWIARFLLTITTYFPYKRFLKSS